MKVCTVQGCHGKHRAKGYCGKHYKQWRKERLGNTVPRDGKQGCKVHACQGKHEAMGFCSKHYKRWRRGTLSIDGVEMKKKPRCRVANCSEEKYMGGYCEQHFNRLLLMKDLWINKVMPIYSNQNADRARDSSYLARIMKMTDIRADLDYDYTAELEYCGERK